MCCCCKTRSAKFKSCGIAAAISGVALLALGISWPFILKPIVMSAASDSTALTKDTQDLWRGIPGKYNISITRATHLYNCTNRDEVSLLAVSIYRLFTKERFPKWQKSDRSCTLSTMTGLSLSSGIYPRRCLETPPRRKMQLRWLSIQEHTSTQSWLRILTLIHRYGRLTRPHKASGTVLWTLQNGVYSPM